MSNKIVMAITDDLNNIRYKIKEANDVTQVCNEIRAKYLTKKGKNKTKAKIKQIFMEIEFNQNGTVTIDGKIFIEQAKPNIYHDGLKEVSY